MNIFCDRVVCVPLIHHKNMRAVEIIGTEVCQDIYVFYEGMETYDHDYR